MNNFVGKNLCVISCVITLTTHATLFATLHKAIGDFSKKPSAVCAHIQTPFKKIGQRLAPCIPDAHADVTLPLASCALYLLSKQILPEVSKAKGLRDGHKAIRVGVTALNLGLGIANFNETWNKDNGDSLDWTLKNGLSTFLLASNAYTLYKLSCAESKT